MAENLFSANGREVAIPNTNESVSVVIPTRKRRRISPLFPRPPAVISNPNPQEMQRRVESFSSWAGSITTKPLKKMKVAARKISPRLVDYVEHLGQKAKEWMKSKNKATKRSLEKDLTVGSVSDAETIIRNGISNSNKWQRLLEKTWDDQFGPDGLLDTILFFEATTDEARLYFEYGDVLSQNLGHMRQQSIPECLKAPKRWYQIKESLVEEREKAFSWWERNSKLKPDKQQAQPETPITDAVRSAADLVGKDFEQVKFEIVTYADRCAYAHSGVAELLEAWPDGAEDLARKIYQDLEWLRRGTAHFDLERREANKRMTRAVEDFRDRHFKFVKMVEEPGVSAKERCKVLKYELGEKKKKKQKQKQKAKIHGPKTQSTSTSTENEIATEENGSDDDGTSSSDDDNEE